MRNSHLTKSKRNQQIRKLLASGKSQAEVARRFNITPQEGQNRTAPWGTLYDKTGQMIYNENMDYASG